MGSRAHIQASVKPNNSRSGINDKGRMQIHAPLRFVRERAESINTLANESLQPLPAPWPGDIGAARPRPKDAAAVLARPVTILAQLEQVTPLQHPLPVYECLLDQIRDDLAVGA